jgi:hypothetical protein
MLQLIIPNLPSVVDLDKEESLIEPMGEISP